MNRFSNNLNNDHWILLNQDNSIEKCNVSRQLFIGSSNFDDRNNNGDLIANYEMSIDEINKKAWSTTLLPLKTMGMTFFMLYMSGSNAGIFSILVVTYALVNAIKILLRVNKQFFELEYVGKKKFLLQKFLYVLYSLLGIFFILYKLGNIGLIPVNRVDYIFNIPQRENVNLVGI